MTSFVNPFLTLQENASQLFSEILKKHASKMACGSGCSQCCHAEFSIFLGEALAIFDWFKNLDADTRAEVLKKWEQPEQKNACAFLRNDQCSVYEARPIICRTQGAPLSLLQNNIDQKKPKKGQKEEITKVVDVCPLNFEEGKSIPKDARDWFDLDRLTHLQSIAENFIEKNSEKGFSIPKELAELCDGKDSGQRRVPLRKLHQLLRTLSG